MRLPDAAYFSAFSIRFSNTRINSSRSPSTSSRSAAACTLISTSRSRASVCRLSATWRMMPTRSTGLSGRRCALSSMRESDSRSSISRAMRVACACMIGRKRSRAAVSSRAEPCRVSMKPDSAASGVRSSWLALATKSARISSTRRSGVRSWNAISTRPRRPAPPSRWHERDRRHDRLVPAVDRHALEELDPLRSAAGDRAADRSPGPRERAAPARPARRAAAPARSRWRAH